MVLKSELIDIIEAEIEDLSTRDEEIVEACKDQIQALKNLKVKVEAEENMTWAETEWLVDLVHSAALSWAEEELS